MKSQKLDFSKCEQEKIHIPSLIQPHGYSIAIDKLSLKVTRSSENVSIVIPLTSILDKPMNFLFPDEISSEILSKLDWNLQKKYVFSNKLIPLFSSSPIDLIICDAEKEFIIEILPNSLSEGDIESIEFVLNGIVKKLITTQEISHLFDLATKEIKKLSGYDRVMIYRFDEEFNGEVIAEAKEEEMEPYLNLHYPASDIPSQARDLYCKNMIRTIVDIHYKPVPLQTISHISEPLDMSYSTLRSVSPIHLEYLNNMGVCATMTISILVNQSLWGLISCHHGTSYSPSLKLQSVCEIFGNILGGIIQMREESESSRKNSELLARLEIIMGILLSRENELDALNLITSKTFLFQSIYKSDGFIFYNRNKIISYNLDLSNSQILLLLENIDTFIENGIFYTNYLVGVCPNLPDIILKMCAGIMVLKLSTNPDSLWIWTREEKTRTISWGGNPNEKAIVNQQGEISPRKSFEKYNQLVTHRSIPWNQSEKYFSQYVIPQFYRLFEFFESNKEIEIHKQKIFDMEQERAKHYKELIEMLVGVIEQRDAYTAGHTKRVADYSVEIAKELELNQKEISVLREAAILHDIGKVIIPDSILLKPGKLSQKEYELIKLHLDVGFQILDKIDYYKPLANIIKYHHEKYDGTGYPYRAKRDEIPLLSHIMIVADSFDAMTTNRIYQARKTVEEALAELLLYRGKWYHPEVVDAAIRATKKFQNKNQMNTSQLPSTQLEKERFSYFFKDQLTGVYNDTYLWMVIRNIIPEIQYSQFALLELHGMSDYNDKFGWHQGNEVIRKFSDILKKYVREEQLFRVYGDDFVICFENIESKEEFLHNWKDLQIDTVSSTCKSVEKDIFLEMFSS